ncbi:hypothetical protein AKJ09_10034 [Labilithrix luteola]|uniref:Uncharacterized protein n=1 Tax=Labilithrix luteola TaxID=1391654 RepID=A0A0K1QC62_9BACT|nr:hypothetical protein AKJ09_10034 [Labilithrix luteola]
MRRSSRSSNPPLQRSVLVRAAHDGVVWLGSCISHASTGTDCRSPHAILRRASQDSARAHDTVRPITVSPLPRAVEVEKDRNVARP